MSSEDAKTSNDDEKSPATSLDLCNKIYNDIDSYINGSINLKNEEAVSQAFKALYEQTERLKTLITNELNSFQNTNNNNNTNNTSLSPNNPFNSNSSQTNNNPNNNNNNNNNNTNSTSTLNSSSGDLPAVQTELMRAETQNLPRELMKEGFVEKRGEGPLKGWKRRYLQLYTNKTMDYYVDSTLKELKGTIYLSNSNIKTSTSFRNGIECNYSLNFGFNIHTNNRKWEFKVESTTERAQWITALHECIEAKGLTYSRGVAKSIMLGRINNNNNTNKFLNSPNTKARQVSNSLSLLGDGAGNNEYLESVQKQLDEATIGKHENVTHQQLENESNIEDLNVPERRFLQLQESVASDTDSAAIATAAAAAPAPDATGVTSNTNETNENDEVQQVNHVESIDI